MNIIDYIIILTVIVWFVASILFIIRAKKKGRNLCCGDCSSCAAGCKAHTNCIANKDTQTSTLNIDE